MLKKRIITALVLILVALAFIVLSSNRAFLYISAIILLFAAWEWGLLVELRNLWYRMLFVFFVALAMIGILTVNIQIVLWVSLAFWLFALLWVGIYPKGADLWGHGAWVRSCMGFLTLVPCWLAINFIRTAQNGVGVLLFLLFLIWSADTGAYFFGKWRGKHKLMKHVSPKKTWEGLLGGVILSLLVAIIGAELLQISSSLWPKILLISFVTVIFSVVGDLFESMLKRQVGIKDTGCYLPGHGGLLDRIDSLTAAAPIFLLMCLLLGLMAF